MPRHPLTRALTLAALSLVLLMGAACGDDKKTQKGQVGTSTTSPETTSTTATPATTTTAAPSTTTTVKATPTTVRATPTTVKAATTTTTATPPTTTPPTTTVTTVAEAYYANCDAARAAGAAPIYEGQPGYRSGLDRDGDGIACDK